MNVKAEEAAFAVPGEARYIGFHQHAPRLLIEPYLTAEIRRVRTPGDNGHRVRTDEAARHTITSLQAMLLAVFRAFPAKRRSITHADAGFLVKKLFIAIDFLC